MSKTVFGTDIFLNMQMIVDDLEEDYNITFYHANRRSVLVTPEIYYGQKELKEDVLYVAEAEVFEKYPIHKNGISRICVGDMGTFEEDPGYSIIVIGDKVNWQEIYNKIQRIFIRYSSWNRRLLDILEGGGGLYELCVAGVDFFRNPLYVHDENFNILAMPMWVVGMNDFVIDENTGNALVPLPTLKRLKGNPEYIKTLSTHKACIWNPKHNSHRVIYVNIWTKEGRYCGRVLIQELNTSFKPSDFKAAEHFAKILSMAFERNLFKTNNVTTFEELLRGLYKDKSYEDSYLKNRMKMVGWKKNHDYICFVTDAAVGDNSIISHKKICSTVGMIIKESFSFAEKDRVYTICNLSLSGLKEKECKEHFEHICDSFYTHSGGSMVFGDLWRFTDYIKQAAKVLETMDMDGESRTLLFSEGVLDYILGHFKDEFDSDMVCSRAVMKLRETDDANKTDYFETLKRYLDNGMQQTLTADELFIHRSTLIYRIKKIEEMTGIDLNDADTRLFIQISMRLYENQ